MQVLIAILTALFQFLPFIGYVFTHLAGGDHGLFADYYERFRVIDLNVDEARVPPPLIRLTGWFVNLWSFLPA